MRKKGTAARSQQLHLRQGQAVRRTPADAAVLSRSFWQALDQKAAGKKRDTHRTAVPRAPGHPAFHTGMNVSRSLCYAVRQMFASLRWQHGWNPPVGAVIVL